MIIVKRVMVCDITTNPRNNVIYPSNNCTEQKGVKERLCLDDMTFIMIAGIGPGKYWIVVGL